MGAVLDRRVAHWLVPTLGFVLLYSLLPHKVRNEAKGCTRMCGSALTRVKRPSPSLHPIFQELRFIIYVFPMVTLAAAVACERLWRSKRFTWFLRLVLVGAVGCSLLATAVFSAAAMHNYPGQQTSHPRKLCFLRRCLILELCVHSEVLLSFFRMPCPFPTATAYH